MSELKVWAPQAHKLEVEVNNRREVMQIAADGWWRWRSTEFKHGSDYSLWLDNVGPWPDPRSCFQPEGPAGPSRWVDHARFQWHDAGWQAAALTQAVFYEMHIGTFTAAGTFASAIEHLAQLRTLGITHIQVMPIAEFGGTRGWGYDGVNLFAAHHTYGGAEGFKQFVDACHAAGLAVILDVVYNHLGPGGDFLTHFGPYFTDVFKTPWGKAVNLDGAWSHEVRSYFVDNALMWLRDFHVDGLRVDAVHALLDRSAIHFLEQLTEAVQALAAQLGRRLVLIAESDLNDPRYLRTVEQGGYGMDAQFNEDFHHALHALLTGESYGYYVDFGQLSDLAQTLAAGYAYAGRYSQHRKRRHGRPALGLDGSRFIASMQNHDQIGNRGEGGRISHIVDTPQLKLGAVLVMLSPFVPMVFQGEEWGATTPFLYFTDFDDPILGDAIRRGRRAELGAYGWNVDNLPDPQHVDTWRNSQLRHEERTQPPHDEILQWYRALMELRSGEPDFSAGPLDPAAVSFDADMGWLCFARGNFIVVCNFSAVQQLVNCDTGAAPLVRLASDAGVRLQSGIGVVLPRWAAAVIQRQTSLRHAGAA